MLQAAQEKAPGHKEDLGQKALEPSAARDGGLLPPVTATGMSGPAQIQAALAPTSIMDAVLPVQAKAVMAPAAGESSANPTKNPTIDPNLKLERAAGKLSCEVLSGVPEKRDKALSELFRMVKEDPPAGASTLVKGEAEQILTGLVKEKTLGFNLRLGIFKELSTDSKAFFARIPDLVGADPEAALLNLNSFREQIRPEALGKLDTPQKQFIAENASFSFINAAFIELGLDGKLTSIPELLKASGYEWTAEGKELVPQFYSSAAISRVQAGNAALLESIQAVPEKYRTAALSGILAAIPERYADFEKPPLCNEAWAKTFLRQHLADGDRASHVVLSYKEHRSPDILKAALPAFFGIGGDKLKADLNDADPAAKSIIESELIKARANEKLLRFSGGDHLRLAAHTLDPELSNLQRTTFELLLIGGKKCTVEADSLAATLQGMPRTAQVELMEKSMLFTRYLHRNGAEVNTETVKHAAQIHAQIMQRYGDIKIFDGRRVLVAANQELLTNLKDSSGVPGVSRGDVRASGDKHRFGKKALMEHIVNQAGDEKLVSLLRPEAGEVSKIPGLVQRKILRDLVETAPGKEGFTFVFDGHGSPEGLYLTGGQADKLASGSSKDVAITVEQMAKALIERHARYPAPPELERRDILVINGCFSHDFARSLLNLLDGRVPLPIIVTSTEYNQYGWSRYDSPYGGMFWERGLKMAREAQTPNFGEKIFNFMAGRRRSIPQPAAHRAMLRDLLDASDSAESNPSVFLPPEADPQPASDKAARKSVELALSERDSGKQIG